MAVTLQSMPYLQKCTKPAERFVKPSNHPLALLFLPLHHFPSLFLASKLN